MKKKLRQIAKAITAMIDFFYPPFRKEIGVQTFRYAVCGGANTAADIFLYFITYNFILDKHIVELPFVAISPHIAAFLLIFPITFLSGFMLSRYVVFPESSESRKRVQLAKYLSVVAVCILLNFGFLKFFIEQLHWWPLPAKIATTVFVVLFSYFSQKKFAFKKTS